MTAADELEYISTDWDASVCLYFLHYFTDKGVVGRIFFYAHYTVTSSGYQFDADASCPRKQIKSYDSFFEIDVVVEHVKQILFCKVVGRALNVRGTSNLLRLYIPLITRMSIRLQYLCWKLDS